MAPKLIGIVGLSLPYLRRLESGIKELIEEVAFDDEGRAWGLVRRHTPIVGGPGARITLDRWLAFDDIPFSEGETLTKWRQEKPPSYALPAAPRRRGRPH